MLPNPTTGRSGRLPSFSLRLRPRRLAGALIWQLLIGHPEETSGVDLYMGQDKKKAASNLRKHDVPFEEAATAFGDTRSLTTIDPDHSIDEERFNSSFSAHRIEGGYWWLHIRSNWIQSELSAHAWRHEARGKFMKRPKKTRREPEKRAEYDFSKGVRGKYVKRLSEGSNLILLDPDVAGLFPDSKTVNDALRALARIAQARAKKAG